MKQKDILVYKNQQIKVEFLEIINAWSVDFLIIYNANASCVVQIWS